MQPLNFRTLDLNLLRVFDEVMAERTWNAALRDARIMADLSRAMNGIAVDDLRRYR